MMERMFRVLPLVLEMKGSASLFRASSRYSGRSSLVTTMSVAKKNIDAETAVKYGAVVGEIVDMAEKSRVDLVVIASHGRSGPGRVFFGSAAAGVLNRIRTRLLMTRPLGG